MLKFHIGFPAPTNAKIAMKDRPSLAGLCEEKGLDTLWHSNERFFYEMFTCMTVSAMATKRIGVGGSIVEPYAVHPAVSAQTAATVDLLAGGRTILALGAGGSGFPMMGIERRRPAATVRDAAIIMRDLLAGKTSTHAGEMLQTHRAHLHVHPKGPIPVFIASRGDRVLQVAGEVADGAMIATYADSQGISHALEQVHRGAERAGRDPRGIRIISRVDTCVHADPLRAFQGVKTMVARFLWLSYPDRNFVRHAGLEVPPELEAVIARRDYDLLDEAAAMVPDSFVRAFCWAGTPEDVADQVVAIARETGIREFGFWMLLAPGQTVEESIGLLADQVLPRIREGLADRLPD